MEKLRTLTITVITVIMVAVALVLWDIVNAQRSAWKLKQEVGMTIKEADPGYLLNAYPWLEEEVTRADRPRFCLAGNKYETFILAKGPEANRTELYIPVCDGCSLAFSDDCVDEDLGEYRNWGRNKFMDGAMFYVFDRPDVDRSSTVIRAKGCSGHDPPGPCVFVGSEIQITHGNHAYVVLNFNPAQAVRIETLVEKGPAFVKLAVGR